MPLPTFGAEASLTRTRGHYRGSNRYGSAPGGIQPSHFYAAETDETAYDETTESDELDESNGDDQGDDTGDDTGSEMDDGEEGIDDDTADEDG